MRGWIQGLYYRRLGGGGVMTPTLFIRSLISALLGRFCPHFSKPRWSTALKFTKIILKMPWFCSQWYLHFKISGFVPGIPDAKPPATNVVCKISGYTNRCGVVLLSEGSWLQFCISLWGSCTFRECLTLIVTLGVTVLVLKAWLQTTTDSYEYLKNILPKSFIK